MGNSRIKWEIAEIFWGHGPMGQGPWARAGARAHKMSILSNLTFLQKRRASSVRFVCTERRAEISHMSPKTAESVVFDFLFFERVLLRFLLQL